MSSGNSVEEFTLLRPLFKGQPDQFERTPFTELNHSETEHTDGKSKIFTRGEKNYFMGTVTKEIENQNRLLEKLRNKIYGEHELNIKKNKPKNSRIFGKFRRQPSKVWSRLIRGPFQKLGTIQASQRKESCYIRSKAMASGHEKFRLSCNSSDPAADYFFINSNPAQPKKTSQCLAHTASSNTYQRSCYTQSKQSRKDSEINCSVSKLRKAHASLNQPQCALDRLAVEGAPPKWRHFESYRIDSSKGKAYQERRIKS